MNLGTAVNAFASPVDGRDLLAKLSVLLIPFAFRTLVPGIISATGNPEYRAH
jgi:hypothetical protein